MVFFDDIRVSNNFMKTVNALAENFINEYGFSQVNQLGLVVPDVIAAAENIEQHGYGPFFIASGRPVFWREKAEDRKVAGKLGLSYHKGVQLELLEPTTGSDFYRNSLDKEGAVVVQHLGFFVKDVDMWVDIAKKRGLPLWVRGQIKSFPLNVHFAYTEPLDENGLIMEFIDWRLFGMHLRPPPAIVKMLGTIEKVTGIRCIKL